ncbi:MAG: K(+)-transporting ATPase subunit F [Polyangiaceae bacterium]
MAAFHWIAGAVAALLFAYLLFAMVWPERLS